MAVTTSCVRATVNVSNGARSSLRRESEPATRRVREKTSNGPAKSSTSTSSKTRMPTVLRASLLMLSPPAYLTYLTDLTHPPSLARIGRRELRRASPTYPTHLTHPTHPTYVTYPTHPPSPARIRRRELRRASPTYSTQLT